MNFRQFCRVHALKRAHVAVFFRAAESLHLHSEQATQQEQQTDRLPVRHMGKTGNVHSAGHRTSIFRLVACSCTASMSSGDNTDNAAFSDNC